MIIIIILNFHSHDILLRIQVGHWSHGYTSRIHESAL